MSDLQLYWGLSSNNQTERIQAAHSLIESLNNESLDYSLTRLIRELVKTAGVDRIIDLLTLEMSSARVGERDGILGLLFGCTSLILGETTINKPTVEKIAALLEKSYSKSYLTSATTQVAVLLLRKLQESESITFLVEKCISFMAEESVDRLYILIEAQAKGCAHIELDGLKNGLIMHTKNVHKFCELLKNATYPEGVVHPIFSAIVEKVSANANATGENKKKYFSLPAFWNEMDLCFTTSHERKFMCFQVFQLMLPSITHIEIPQIMTPNFLKCYINTLSNKKSVLFPQATSVTKSLVSAAQDSKVGLGIVMALMNNKLFTFDALTKTKTVENILSNLDVAAMEEYTAHLIMVSAESDQLASWAAEQMATLVRNGVIIKHEAYISSIVTHLVTKGFFVESPASSTIREKLLSVLGSLGNVSLGYIKNTSSTPEEQKKAAVIAKKTMGKMNDGKSWFTFALEKFTATKESTKPVVALDEESQTAVDSCLAAIKSLEKKEGADKDAMTALLTFTVLEMHHVSSSETATDLAEVTLRIFASKSKKRKTTEPEALEVLVDTLLALLAKDSAVVRHLATEVFKAFVDRIGTAGVDLCFGVLNAGEGAAGHDELFDEEDGDHASDDDSDSGSDDSEEDVIMEVGDERIGAENDKLTDSVIAAIKEAQSGNADEEEPELPDLNDEEMTAFDAHLSNIFAQKKTIAKEKKQTKVTVLHFKLRALDIVEEFVKAGRHCFYIMKLLVPLYAALATSRDNLSLHTKIGSVLLKLSKEKREIGVESKDAAEMLESIHTRFKKCSLPMLNIYSSLSLFVVRALLEEKPDSQKPVKDINAEEQILKVYTNSLKGFIHNKNTHIKPSIFLDFIARFPLLAKQLIPTVLEVESASLSWFVVTYTLSLLPAVAKLTEIKEYTAEIEAAYTAILKRAATAEGVPADRLKQLLKDLTQLVKHVKVNVAEFIDVLCTEERMSTFKSLKNLVKGYKAAYERV